MIACSTNRKILFCIFLFTTIQLLSQNKQDYVWKIGNDQDVALGIQALTMDFNSSPAAVEVTENGMTILGNNASICDKDGNLQLYFNGCMILNGSRDLVEHGDSINFGKFQQEFWGECRDSGYPGSQDVMILPDPIGPQKYYVIHKKIEINPNDNNFLRLNYSHVDMSLGTSGVVTEKNVSIGEGEKCLGRYLTAIATATHDGWWLIQPKVQDSMFLVYLLDRDGIHPMVDQSSFQYFDHDRSSSSGTAKFSPDGLHYAIYNYYDQLHLYDFDRSTGVLSNHKSIKIYPSEEIDRETIRFASVEWSSNSRFIYCASSLELHQVDMWEEDPQDGVRHIATYEEFLDPFQTDFHLQALAPDCRIYIAPGSSSRSYHVINKPNEVGNDCDFVQNGIQLPISAAGKSFPNHPRFRVDEEDKCDPTITSVFGEAVYYRRQLEVYPNPSTGPMTVVVPSQLGKGELVVLNVQGQVVFSKELQHGTLTQQLDLSFLPSGHYNVELYPSDNKERVFYGEQVVIQR